MWGRRRYQWLSGITINMPPPGMTLGRHAAHTVHVREWCAEAWPIYDHCPQTTYNVKVVVTNGNGLLFFRIQSILQNNAILGRNNSSCILNSLM